MRAFAKLYLAEEIFDLTHGLSKAWERMAPKVLVVDDDSLMHMLYRKHLEQAGFEVLAAKNGVEALEVAARESPQVIFMDVMMPELDGLSALRELKKADATKAIPVVVITGNATTYAAARRESELGGAAGFLSKPFSPAQLLAEVRRLLPS